jgi:hypothetical protein
MDDLVVHNLLHKRMYFWWFDTADEIRVVLEKQGLSRDFINDFVDWMRESYTHFRVDYVLLDYLRRLMQEEMKCQGNYFHIGENSIRTQGRRACRIRRRELQEKKKQERQ